MKATSSFIETRKPVTQTGMEKLWDKLTKRADRNTALYVTGILADRELIVDRKFHVKNTAGFYVNVILSKKNNITVRGKIYNDYVSLERAIQNICD